VVTHSLEQLSLMMCAKYKTVNIAMADVNSAGPAASQGRQWSHSMASN